MRKYLRHPTIDCGKSLQNIQIEWERLNNDVHERVDVLQRSHDLYDDIVELNQRIQTNFERFRTNFNEKFDDENLIEQMKNFLGQIKVKRKKN